jgi:2-oxoglutarate dehydrogenase E2 component (dihydrolipoamide succinyltransferase)
MAVEVVVPALGESIVEATVGRWRKHEGEAVQEGEPLVDLETDKVNVEVHAPKAGVLAAIRHREGEEVTVGAVLALLEEAGAAEAAAPAPAGEPPTAAPAEAGPPVAGPAVRRLAAELGVDLNRLRGSGPHGRITAADVEAAARATSPTSAPPPLAPTVSPAPPPPTPAPPAEPEPARAVPSGVRPEERVRLSRRRLTIARRLVEVQHTAAHLTTFNEVDMSAVLELRRTRGEAFYQRHGVRLGLMSFFTKAVVAALKEMPRLNAEIQGDEMVLKRYYDIGIAVATDEGLVVPVLRQADRLNFAEIERAIADLAERARAGTLTLEDLRGGTFTITNGGVFGSLFSTPILNPPQVGILGMHSVNERPVAVEGRVEIRPMMYLALSYDHRIVDGSEAVRFLVTVKRLVEDPVNLLLEG